MLTGVVALAIESIFLNEWFVANAVTGSQALYLRLKSPNPGSSCVTSVVCGNNQEAVGFDRVQYYTMCRVFVAGRVVLLHCQSVRRCIREVKMDAISLGYLGGLVLCVGCGWCSPRFENCGWRVGFELALPRGRVWSVHGGVYWYVPRTTDDWHPRGIPNS